MLALGNEHFFCKKVAFYLVQQYVRFIYNPSHLLGLVRLWSLPEHITQSLSLNLKYNYNCVYDFIAGFGFITIMNISILVK